MKKIFIIITSLCLATFNFAQDVCGVVINAEKCSNNGKINLTMNGGIAPFTYNWSTGATTEDIENLAPGWYYVTVTDYEGGEVILAFEVIEDPAQNPIKLLYKKNQGNCGSGKFPGIANGRIEIELADPDNYTYCWKQYPSDPICTFTTQNIQNLGIGTYYLIATNKNTGCTVSKQVEICCCYDSYDPESGGTPHPNACRLNAVTPLRISATPTAPTKGNSNGAIAINVTSGSLNGYTIKWTSTGTPIPLNAGLSLANLAPGRYCYTISNGCNELRDCYDLYYCEDNPIKITGTLVRPCEHSLFTTKGNISISVSNGKSPYKYLWNNGLSSPNLTNLTKGTYTLKVTDKSGCSQTATFTLDPGKITSEKVTNESCVEVFQCDGVDAHEQPLPQTTKIDPNPSVCKKYTYCDSNPNPIKTTSGSIREERDDNDCRIVSIYCYLDNNKTLIRRYKDDTYNKFQLDFVQCKVFEKCRYQNIYGTTRMHYADGEIITKDWFDCIQPVDCKTPKGTCGEAKFCKLYNPETKKFEEEIMANTFIGNNITPTGIGAKANSSCTTGKSIDIICDDSTMPVRTVCATGVCDGGVGKIIKFETVPLSSLYVKDYIRMLIEMGEASSNTDILLPEGVDACTDIETFNNRINAIMVENNGISNGYKQKAIEILNFNCEINKSVAKTEDTFIVFPNPFENNVSVKCNLATIKSYEIVVFDNLG
jgi:hypothetical protein